MRTHLNPSFISSASSLYFNSSLHFVQLEGLKPPAPSPLGVGGISEMASISKIKVSLRSKGMARGAAFPKVLPFERSEELMRVMRSYLLWKGLDMYELWETLSKMKLVYVGIPSPPRMLGTSPKVRGKRNSSLCIHVIRKHNIRARICPILPDLCLRMRPLC